MTAVRPWWVPRRVWVWIRTPDIRCRRHTPELILPGLTLCLECGVVE